MPSIRPRKFRDTAGVTGLVLTKLDGTAKGGILFALAKRTGLPIRFIGVGEQLEDLRPFNRRGIRPGAVRGRGPMKDSHDQV